MDPQYVKRGACKARPSLGPHNPARGLPTSTHREVGALPLLCGSDSDQSGACASRNQSHFGAVYGRSIISACAPIGVRERVRRSLRRLLVCDFVALALRVCGAIEVAEIGACVIQRIRTAGRPPTADLPAGMMRSTLIAAIAALLVLATFAASVDTHTHTAAVERLTPSAAAGLTRFDPCLRCQCSSAQ